MKICPQCEKVFADSMNYCLEDGVILVNYDAQNPQQTVSHTEDPTLQYRNQGETREELTKVTQNRTTFGQSYQKLDRPNIFLVVGSVFGIIVLVAAGVVGGFLYLRSRIPPRSTPTPYRSYTPYRTPTPKPENKIKVEILEKVDGSFGQKFLKCKITNTSEDIVTTPSITLSFYQNDVKLKDAYGSSKLKFLKPNQTIPVWVNIYGVEKYTSVKVKEPVTARAVSKPEAEVFPKLLISETSMNGEKGSLSYNFRSYTKIFWKVRGIIETAVSQKNSTVLYALYKDEKNEIVGIEETRLSDLKVGEKTKFEVSECEIDMFGTPKTFEIIAVNDSVY